MTKNHICLLMLAAIIAAPSCKKKDNTVPTPGPPIDSTVNISYDNYMMLKPGNYWIYQNYKLDSVNGEAHPMGTYDSCYVEKDTLMGLKLYHKYLSKISPFGSPTDYNTRFLRDSLSYTIDNTGRILFSSEDFTSIFRSFTYGPNAATDDTLYITERMGLKDETTIVDAGTFTTSAFRRIYRYPDDYPYGQHREYDYRYAKHIGLVRETTGFYSLSPMVYERRLVRYHVKRTL
jgi:hypothetical protein